MTMRSRGIAHWVVNGIKEWAVGEGWPPSPFQGSGQHSRPVGRGRQGTESPHVKERAVERGPGDVLQQQLGQLSLHIDEVLSGAFRKLLQRHRLATLTSSLVIMTFQPQPIIGFVPLREQRVLSTEQVGSNFLRQQLKAGRRLRLGLLKGVRELLIELLQGTVDGVRVELRERSALQAVDAYSDAQQGLLQLTQALIRLLRSLRGDARELLETFLPLGLGEQRVHLRKQSVLQVVEEFHEAR